MDLTFTPDEQAFRERVREWVAKSLPKDISHKVHNALQLTRDDLQRWARVLGKQGWHGYRTPTAGRRAHISENISLKIVAGPFGSSLR